MVGWEPRQGREGTTGTVRGQKMPTEEVNLE